MQGSPAGRRVGSVVELFRYPVKSMGPESLSAVDVAWHGFSGDRRWAFIREGVTTSGFPWLTQRTNAAMAQYRPAFIDPTRPEASALVVQTPDGEVLDLTEPDLAEQLDPSGAGLIKQRQGIFDTFPLSLITTQTIAALGEIVGTRLDPQRFRPNLLVAAEDAAPFPEDAWVGRTLRIGGLRLRVDKRDGRCAVITVDPTSAERDPSILRAVAQNRQGQLGVYASVVQPGAVAVGDAVTIEH